MHFNRSGRLYIRALIAPTGLYLVPHQLVILSGHNREIGILSFFHCSYLVGAQLCILSAPTVAIR